jgi:hypothetical protein
LRELKSQSHESFVNKNKWDPPQYQEEDREMRDPLARTDLSRDVKVKYTVNLSNKCVTH